MVLPPGHWFDDDDDYYYYEEQAALYFGVWKFDIIHIAVLSKSAEVNEEFRNNPPKRP